MSDSDRAADASSPALNDFLTSVTRRPCRIVLSWGMAGGLIAGGFLVAATTLAGREAGSQLQNMIVLLFGLGAAAGMTHGALLAYLARCRTRSRAAVLRDLFHSLTFTTVGLVVSGVAAVWISLTAAIVGGPDARLLPTLGIGLAWLYGTAVCVWAAWEGLQGLQAAYARWPYSRTISILVSVVFAGLLTGFLLTRPEIWFTDLRVNGIGATILAFGATVWIALPVAIGGITLLHGRRAA